MTIITKIMGGLGNQMFQYACAKALACRLGAKLQLDKSWFAEGNRVFQLDAFPAIRVYNAWKPNILQRIKLCKIRYTKESKISYWSEILNIKSSVHLRGYWQNEKYFSDISSIIKQDFSFPDFLCAEAENIAKKIKSSPCSVSIHVRRGDYLENIDYHGLCSPEYYEKALEIIADKSKERLDLFLFSDDPQWVKDNFDSRGNSVVIVDIEQHKDAPYHDMHLMSLCKHHIIANSSFSWWGAWLSTENGTVIAPKCWFAEETIRQHNPATETWIKI